MTHFENNLKDFESVLGWIDDWIVDLKDQRAELDDIETYTKELYEIMYEFETIKNSVEQVAEYIDKAKEVRL
jgi:hypothetical protein